jgi:hypothetical protein
MKGANSVFSNHHYASTAKEEEQQHNNLHRYHLKLQPPPLRASLKTTLHRPFRNISKNNCNFQTSQLK